MRTLAVTAMLLMLATAMEIANGSMSIMAILPPALMNVSCSENMIMVRVILYLSDRGGFRKEVLAALNKFRSNNGKNALTLSETVRLSSTF